MISKAQLKRIYQKTLKNYPWSAKLLLPLLHSYRWARHRLTHWPKKQKVMPYSQATYRLYQRSQSSLNKLPRK